MTENDIQVAVVGSIGIDTVETPKDKRVDILGGSSSFAAVAAAWFANVGLVGVVGTDFTDQYMDIYRNAGVDLAGLQVKEGQTFRWSGVYENNMNKRRTLSTELNVFQSFMPELPEAYKTAPFLFLGNISPDLQLHVLNQMNGSVFSLVDTMDLWINTARKDLDEVVKRVDMLTLNDAEARQYTGEDNIIKAAKMMLERGPAHVLIKKGEHGSILFSKEDTFLMSAFPIESLVDPTGAGDTFAGALIGALARSGSVSHETLREAIMYGNIIASFVVEDFSLNRLITLDMDQIEERASLFCDMICI